jgi:hypothetical protein
MGVGANQHRRYLYRQGRVRTDGRRGEPASTFDGNSATRIWSMRVFARSFATRNFRSTREVAPCAFADSHRQDDRSPYLVEGVANGAARGLASRDGTGEDPIDNPAGRCGLARMCSRAWMRSQVCPPIGSCKSIGEGTGDVGGQSPFWKEEAGQGTIASHPLLRAIPATWITALTNHLNNGAGVVGRRPEGKDREAVRPPFRQYEICMERGSLLATFEATCPSSSAATVCVSVCVQVRRVWICWIQTCLLGCVLGHPRGTGRSS